MKRTIGAKSLAINAMNLTIGGGIFVVPALVAEKLGPASIVAYFMCAGLMVLIMLCFAEIGSKVTDNGGSYAYVERAFGPYAGYLINILFWLGYAVFSDAAIANAMADMMGLQFPIFNQTIPRILFFLLIFAFFSWVNIRGTKNGSGLVWINTLLKLIPLVLLIVAGFFRVEVSNLQVESWPEFKSYGEIALILFFAFQGTETALNISGEVKNPQKSIPKGIFMGLFGVLLFYILIQTVAQGVLGNDLPNNPEAPLAVTAQKILGPFGFQLIIIGGIISIFGTLSGDVLATPRMIYAGSKKGLYPGIFGKIHPKFDTPVYSIILFSSLIVIFASIGEFKQLALISSSATLVIYLMVALATVKMRINRKKSYPNAFIIPGGLTIPILAILVIIYFLLHVSIDEVTALISFFVIFSIIYYFFTRKRELKN